jgi:hypothetical protein
VCFLSELTSRNRPGEMLGVCPFALGRRAENFLAHRPAIGADVDLAPSGKVGEDQAFVARRFHELADAVLGGFGRPGEEHTTQGKREIGIHHPPIRE